jgi:hypothetical protein
VQLAVPHHHRTHYSVASYQYHHAPAPPAILLIHSQHNGEIGNMVLYDDTQYLQCLNRDNLVKEERQGDGKKEEEDEKGEEASIDEDRDLYDVDISAATSWEDSNGDAIFFPPEEPCENILAALHIIRTLLMTLDDELSGRLDNFDEMKLIDVCDDMFVKFCEILRRGGEGIPYYYSQRIGPLIMDNFPTLCWYFDLQVSCFPGYDIGCACTIRSGLQFILEWLPIDPDKKMLINPAACWYQSEKLCLTEYDDCFDQFTYDSIHTDDPYLLEHGKALLENMASRLPLHHVWWKIISSKMKYSNDEEEKEKEEDEEEENDEENDEEKREEYEEETVKVMKRVDRDARRSYKHWRMGKRIGMLMKDQVSGKR